MCDNQCAPNCCHTIPTLEYYWREYFGAIPKDAFIAGTDIDGNNVYIGQGYYRDHGLKPGRLTPGVKEMPVPWGRNNKISTYNKILCGRQENFYWMKATAKDLHVQVGDKHAVIGGHDDGNGYLNIGRINYGGSIKIGKVMSCWPGNAIFFYIDGPNEKDVTNYEVLMYRRSYETIDPRMGSEYDGLKVEFS